MFAKVSATCNGVLAGAYSMSSAPRVVMTFLRWIAAAGTDERGAPRIWNAPLKPVSTSMSVFSRPRIG